MNDEQRIVDREREADEFDDIRDVEDHEKVVGEEIDDTECAGDRRPGDEKRYERRPADSQDGDEQHDGENECEGPAPAKITF